MSISSFWSNISYLGLEKNAIGHEVAKIKLVNQLGFIALLASSLTVVSQWFVPVSSFLHLATMGNVLLEAFILFLNAKQRFVLARHLGCFLFPTWISLQVILTGGSFGETQIFTAAGFLAFLLYEGQFKIRIFSVAYIFILFLITKLLLIEFYPDMPVNPYDEIISFPAIFDLFGAYFNDLSKRSTKIRRPKKPTH